MFRQLLVAVIALTVVSCADAGPFRRRAEPECQACPPVEEPRFARLMAPRPIPPYITNPGPFTDRPVLRLVVRAGFAGMVLAQSEAISWVGFGVPRAIRAGRVLLLGSPTPGRPGATALWVASPTLLWAYEKVRERRNGTGGGAGYGMPVYGGYYAAPSPDCPSCGW